MQRVLHRVLVVEDDPCLSTALMRLARSWSAEAQHAAHVADAIHALDTAAPDLLLVDVRLPDGTAFDVIQAAARLLPAPAIVAMSGEASAADGFRLCALGVRGFVQKPFTTEAITRAVESARGWEPPLERFAGDLVGRVPLPEAQRVVRRVMVEHAIRRAGGNRSHAAELIGVSRQAVQQVMRARRTPRAVRIDSAVR